MTSKTHIALGLLTASLIHKYYPHINSYDLFTAVGIGSLMPDLDTKKSDPSQIFPPVSYVVDKFTKHRGFTHTLLPLLFIIAYFAFKSDICLYVGIGGLTHLIIDVVTFRVGIKCNSFGEQVLYIIFWTLVIGLFVDYLWINYGDGLIRILNKIYLESGG